MYTNRIYIFFSFFFIEITFARDKKNYLHKTKFLTDLYSAINFIKFKLSTVLKTDPNML